MSAIENVGRRRIRCPRCDLPLSPLKSAGALLAGCSKCRGVWLDRHAFTSLGSTHLTAKNATGSREACIHASNAAQTVKCPVCYYWMDAKNLGGSPELIIDVCRRHGAWFDASELHAIRIRFKKPDAPNNAFHKAASLTAGASLTAAAATAAPLAANAPAHNDRSILERTGEIMSEAIDLVDFIDIGDIGGGIGDLISGMAEIGAGLFSGLG